MTIINPKQREADEEAERLARQRQQDYTQRYDSSATSSFSAAAAASASQGDSEPETQPSSRHYDGRPSARLEGDWMQPPPAYEEGARHSPVAGPVQEQNAPQADSGATGHPEVNEATSLLFRRQGRYSARKYRMQHRHVWKCGALLFVLAAVLLLLKLLPSRQRDPSSYQPDAPASDGEVVDGPHWSPPQKTDPNKWGNPILPLYTSTTYFSLPAHDDLTFLRVRAVAASGPVVVRLAEELSDEEWKKRNGGHVQDRILFSIEAQFSHVALRDAIRVSQMHLGDRMNGIGIYSGELPKIPGQQWIEFIIHIYLPQPNRRTANGLASDGSSMINHLELFLNSMRLAVEFPEVDAGRAVTFGRFEDDQLNGGAELVGELHATKRIDLSLSNGHVRDIGTPRLVLRAPIIAIFVRNGPIWVPTLRADKRISLKTNSGGINVTDSATAPEISVYSTSSVIEGMYVPTESLDVSASAGRIKIEVDLGHNAGDALSRAGNFDSIAQERASATAQTVSVRSPLKRRVNVENEQGTIDVQYMRHSPNVELRSVVKAESGFARVGHDVGFEGSFMLRTTIGSIDVGDSAAPKSNDEDMPSSNKEHNTAAKHIDPASSPFVGSAPFKRVVIDKDDRTHIGAKYVEGHVFWSTHVWPPRGLDGRPRLSDGSRDYVRSSSVVTNTLGKIEAQFS